MLRVLTFFGCASPSLSLRSPTTTATRVPLHQADECHQAGVAIRNMLEKQIVPSMIMTKAAFENAMVTVMALGGSTNAVLHLIAMSRAVGVDLTIDDFQRVSDYTPFIADLKPSGAYTMEDLYYVSPSPPQPRAK